MQSLFDFKETFDHIGYVEYSTFNLREILTFLQGLLGSIVEWLP